MIASLGRGDSSNALVQLIVVSCAVIYALTLIVDPDGIQMNGMFNFLSPGIEGTFLFGASGAIPVFRFGRWWTVLSASWLHGSLLHILFNMMWVRNLAPAVIDFYGVSRMVIIYTISGVVGFLASSVAGHWFVFMPSVLRGAGFTVGASAAIFGLLGALVYYGRRTGSSMVGQQARGFALLLFIFGFVMPSIDNWAHLGGFVGGYFSSMWFDPLQPERLDHMVGALACLGLTALAIVLSVFHGIQFIG
jgi:rhomboid protease GluP